jgi:cyclopropane fatty-acyl-phospholipid synthase-like methyltransferase
MTMSADNLVYLTDEERKRILRLNARRERDIRNGRFAPWQPAAALMRASRRRVAAKMLHTAGVFPDPGDRCLEIGCGMIGWMGDLITWGLRETDLHGIELDPQRASIARQALPRADLRTGDASRLPWAEESFSLVIASTVFTSILDAGVRETIAGEIQRVLKQDGALLWYDFFRNNPANPHTRAVGRKELRGLFPDLTGDIQSVTLAPPLANFVAPRSWIAATALEGIPWLRTHLIAVLVKR